MPHHPDSLLQIFGNGDRAELDRGMNDLLESDEFDGLRRQVAAVPWPGSARTLAYSAGALLDGPITDILVRCWNKSGMFKKYVDPDAYDPDEVFLVELKEHTVKSKQEPSLEVRFDGALVTTIKFAVEVELKLHTVVLKVQDARIKAIQPGAVKGSGKVTCHGLVLVEKKDVTLRLPGEIELSGGGIPIAP